MNWNHLSFLQRACEQAVAKAAKTEESTLYLPLWMHLTDTAGIMQKLFEDRISEHERILLTEACGSEEKARKLLTLAGYCHDLGKMTSIFQATILNHILKYEKFEIPLLKPAEYGKPQNSHHTFTGTVILLWLGCPENFASLAGSHHGVLIPSPVNGSRNAREKAKQILTNDYQIFFGQPALENRWEEAWTAMWTAILNIIGLSLEEIPVLDIHILMLIAGILVEADWISSNPDYFPLLNLTEEGDPKQYPQRIEAGWKKLDFPAFWNSPVQVQNEHLFEQLFGFKPRLLQENVLTICEGIKQPGLMIIEAPMGLGKTEAAMLAADIFARKTSAGGVFFGLPTQATANGLYPRFSSWARKEAGAEQLILKMIHGGAGFNQEFQKLPRGTAHVDEENQRNSLFLHEWMQGRKQGILSDFVIGTVDQAFMSVLKHRHLMLRHAGLAGKVVVIDEVHAYDAYMNVYFDQMLLWLGLYRAPVILLSATLPIKRRMQMVEAYLKGRNGGQSPEMAEQDWMKSSAYPSIVWTDGLEVRLAANMEGSVPEVKVSLEKREILGTGIEEEKLTESLKQALADGGCAGVIVNTVNRAQAIGDYLRNHLPDCHIIVFHSRFTLADRTRRENEVLRRIGKTSTATERNKVIVVGTQVIEQSLDIDFDILYTELAPMDLLLQRVGRLHRHKRTDRPASLQKPTCVVMTGRNGNLDPAVKEIYDAYILKQTQRLLPDSLTLPADIPNLVNQVYKELEAPDENDKYDYEKRLLKEALSQNKASAHLLEYPASRRLTRRGLDGLMESGDDLEADESLVSAVRDIKPSVTCLLLKENKEGKLLPVSQDGWSGEWEAGGKPDQISLNDLLLQKISLPASLPCKETEREMQQRMNESGWFSSLPKGLNNMLILVMDDQGKTRIGKYLLQYLPDDGLKVIRESDKETE